MNNYSKALFALSLLIINLNIFAVEPTPRGRAISSKDTRIGADNILPKRQLQQPKQSRLSKSKLFIDSMREYAQQLNEQAQQESMDAQVLREMAREVRSESNANKPGLSALIQAALSRAGEIESKALRDQEASRRILKSVDTAFSEIYPAAREISSQAKIISKEMINQGLNPDNLEEVLLFLRNKSKSFRKPRISASK